MEFTLSINDKSIHDLMEEIGYQSAEFKKEGEFSMSRQLKKGSIYPRFHLYGERLNSHTVLRLHLDRSESWDSQSLDHSREYDGAVVEKEAERIKNIIEKSRQK